MSYVVERHPARAAIDAALLDPARSTRAIAREHGLSEASVRRYRSKKFPQLARAAAARQRGLPPPDGETPAQAAQREADEKAGGAILARLRKHAEEAESILATAKRKKDWRLALSALSALRGQLAFEAGLTGELQPEKTEVNVGVQVTFQETWIQIRTNILEALERHPEAKADVLRALEKAGAGDGSGS